MATAFARTWNDSDHMNDGWWWVMGIGWLVFLAAIVIVIVLLVRQFDRRRGGDAGSSSDRAEAILGERLARGEIDEDEYRRRRDALRQ